ncbi:MAG: tRNA guanosine(34) transglycosylase Tgt, partial [Phycisphaerae bacterium]|nr:tRNA guanosine(34) transglycosylase Tgt [Phycisphaerae bacterium]
MFEFGIGARDLTTAARVGRLTTPHGVVDTPAFMPIGTRAAVKGVLPAMVRQAGAQMILANTYHLTLRPGAEVIEQLGGLHRFMNWGGPILTDSGGYQVFSLADLATIDDDGVSFRSHIDGALMRLDPEIAMRIENQLGADVIMAFDECPPYPAERQVIAGAVERTLRWAGRCKAAHARGDQALFAIVQGGIHHDLRRMCAERLVEIGFPGYAVGGLSVGEPHELMVEVLQALGPHLPTDRPRYLMGVGMPADIVAAVQAGIDMFDCVLPTRNGRNAYAFTPTGPLRLRNEKHRLDERPLETGCDCVACTGFSQAYIRHLFLAGEMLGPILVSLHNLRF